MASMPPIAVGRSSTCAPASLHRSIGRHDDDRRVRMAGDVVRHRAQQETSEAAESAAAHDEEVGVLGGIEQARGRPAGDDRALDDDVGGARGSVQVSSWRASDRVASMNSSIMS
jgi:hypothetical protein